MSDPLLEEAIKRTVQGDIEAFRLVYDKSCDDLFRLVSLLIGNKSDVCDVVNEIYAELFRSLGSYDTRKPFKAWLTGLAIRQTRSWNRRSWRKFRLFERHRLMQHETAGIDSEQLVIQEENKSELIRLVHGLSYKLRSVIVLRYYNDCSFEEIAELLAIPVGTAKSRHNAALGKLRTQRRILRQLQGGVAVCPSKPN